MRVKSEGDGQKRIQIIQKAAACDEEGSDEGDIALKKGPWTTTEDAILMDYVQKHGEGNWNIVQKNSGLSRCGKSCRLRWTNHLRPDLKKGTFSEEEERRIIELHAKYGNKWARMATELPGRTDNEIKNFWNTRIKRLQRAGKTVYPSEIFPEHLTDNGEFGMLDMHTAGSYHSDLLQESKFEIPLPVLDFEKLKGFRLAETSFPFVNVHERCDIPPISQFAYSPEGHHHMPETRGLCLSEEQCVTTIIRRPRIEDGHRIRDMVTEPYRLVRRCEVTAILILYGLPRLLTGSILAHEMMHAWLRLNGYPSLSPEVEEGICQVLAHMWIDSEIYSGSGSNVASSSSPSSSSSSSSPTSGSSSSKKGRRSDFEKVLGEFFKHQIESDTSAAYGDGFRTGNQAILNYGLRRTLDHIKLTGSFPM